MISDTIAAIATSTAASGAISIIRISGDEAFNIVNRIFKGKNLLEQASHTIHYGFIIDPISLVPIDEVLIMLMRGPRSFTTEDIIEINCHGGTFVTNKILELVLKTGARLAHPGEFSKRAFLNGRIDLSEAEAIMDIIEAKSDHALKLGINTLDKKVSKLVENLKDQILQIIAIIEVNIDYPEYDEVVEMTHTKLIPKSKEVYNSIMSVLSTATTGQILKNGIKTAIIGRPNVGKSSLLNQLMREDKAIVTSIAGTTRDTVEGMVNLGGITLNLIDTAGIRNTDDVVEAIGVEKSRNLIEEAELILLVLNASEPLTPDDYELLELTKDKNRIILLNKSDLQKEIVVENISDFINTSMIDESGLDELELQIKNLFQLNIIKDDQTLISNTRHIAQLNEAKDLILSAITQLELGMPIDIVEMDLKTAWEVLGQILGDFVSDALIDELFTKFCLGK